MSNHSSNLKKKDHEEWNKRNDYQDNEDVFGRLSAEAGRSCSINFKLSGYATGKQLLMMENRVNSIGTRKLNKIVTFLTFLYLTILKILSLF